MKILVVEDLFFMRRVIKHSLNGMGERDVAEAADGVQALQYLSKNKCDLILCDWLMPNMNGLQLVETLRNEPAYKEIPVIMITTISDKESIVHAMKAGISEFIAKPFTPECLQKKVMHVAYDHDNSECN